MTLTTSTQDGYSQRILQNNKTSIISQKVLVDLVACLDILAIIAMAYLAKILYLDWLLHIDVSFRIYFFPSILTALLFFMILKNRGFYNPKDEQKKLAGPWKIVSSLALAYLISMSVLYFAKVAEVYSRGWVLLWFVLALLSLLILREIWKLSFHVLTKQGRFRRRVAVVGEGDWGSRVITHLQSNENEVDFIGYFSVSDDDDAPLVSHIAHLAQQGNLDQIIIAMPLQNFQKHKRMLHDLKFLSVDIELAPEHLSLDIPIRSVTRLDNLNILSVQKKPITGWGIFLKSLEDRLLGSFFFVMSLPLMLMIALSIKLGSRGPVFFIQRRHGLNGQIIRVVKFRTMTVLEDGAEVRQAGQNDQRVTRVGRILRKTSFDELPQLWNVLRGDMSLVGPRPHALTHDHYYSQMFEIYANRQRVKPGLTGWAQVNGLRGETSDPELMRARIDHDIFYIENWSLWLDIKIIIATFFVGFINKKAY